jgi:hypothetical protein
MANIKVSELSSAGSELFMDSESFLQDLADTDVMSVHGGEGNGFQKYLEYGVVGLGINNIASLAKSFSPA